ncbi:hypothetical protein CC78DRAFT_590773 [Lojkania enalia]|uniref:Uncharacterized protein n=1 Tax=Lojkania enalia TaxID=147567 RepID=A0A9P4JZE8_9PLEO|nr:hypothetical protein CC78DRAFT_590773 [Didymosphaeria enalia]
MAKAKENLESLEHAHVDEIFSTYTRDFYDDLTGGTWEDGLRAIKEFDWSVNPEDRGWPKAPPPAQSPVNEAEHIDPSLRAVSLQEATQQPQDPVVQDRGAGPQDQTQHPVSVLFKVHRKLISKHDSHESLSLSSEDGPTILNISVEQSLDPEDASMKVDEAQRNRSTRAAVDSTALDDPATSPIVEGSDVKEASASRTTDAESSNVPNLMVEKLLYPDGFLAKFDEARGSEGAAPAATSDAPNGSATSSTIKKISVQEPSVSKVTDVESIYVSNPTVEGSLYPEGFLVEIDEARGNEGGETARDLATLNVPLINSTTKESDVKKSPVPSTGNTESYPVTNLVDATPQVQTTTETQVEEVDKPPAEEVEHDEPQLLLDLGLIAHAQSTRADDSRTGGEGNSDGVPTQDQTSSAPSTHRNSETMFDGNELGFPGLRQIEIHDELEQAVEAAENLNDNFHQPLPYAYPTQARAEEKEVTAEKHSVAFPPEAASSAQAEPDQDDEILVEQEAPGSLPEPLTRLPQEDTDIGASISNDRGMDGVTNDNEGITREDENALSDLSEPPSSREDDMLMSRSSPESEAQADLEPTEIECIGRTPNIPLTSETIAQEIPEHTVAPAPLLTASSAMSRATKTSTRLRRPPSKRPRNPSSNTKNDKHYKPGDSSSDTDNEAPRKKKTQATPVKKSAPRAKKGPSEVARKLVASRNKSAYSQALDTNNNDQDYDSGEHTASEQSSLDELQADLVLNSSKSSRKANVPSDEIALAPAPQPNPFLGSINPSAFNKSTTVPQDKQPPSTPGRYSYETPYGKRTTRSDTKPASNSVPANKNATFSACNSKAAKHQTACGRAARKRKAGRQDEEEEEGDAPRRRTRAETKRAEDELRPNAHKTRGAKRNAGA